LEEWLMSWSSVALATSAQSTSGVRAKTLSSVLCEPPALGSAVAPNANAGALASVVAAASAVLV
jgi:hypothetical protein